MDERRRTPPAPGEKPIKHIDSDAFRLLVESTGDYAIFMLDPEGHVLTWNAGAERMKGYTANEIIGSHFSVFYPPDALARNWPAHELEVAARVGRFEDEGWRLRKDGSRFWANVVITALRDRSGQLIGFGKVSRDLTERRRAEQQLQESEERFRLIVDSTMDYAIFMLDPDGNVASWNQGAQRVKGYAASEIIGKHFSTFYTPQAIATGWPQHELREAARIGRFEDEGWRLRKDGTRFWANVVITALRGANGELRGFAKVTRDITERRAHQDNIERLKEELEQRVVELAATNRELSQKSSENESFVYGVSHDLRSPLVNLQGFSHELSRTSDALRQLLARPDVPADVRQQAASLLSGDFDESIGFIRNAVQHLGNIIDGLLRLSRVGRVVYDMNAVDANLIVSDILAAMHNSIANSHGRVDVDPLPVVMADKHAFGQVVANIVGNALKAFDPNRPGRIRISASRQGDASLDRAKSGLGIGLALVKQVTALHGGSVTAHSEGAGRGSEFVVRLPATPEEPVTVRDDTAREDSSSRSMRVVVVDDQQDIADSVALLVRMLGHQATAVYDGPAALALTESAPPDVMFVDIGMPGMTGYDVAERIREKPELDGVRLVALTGYGREEDRAHALGSGFDLHVTKPLTDARLRDVLSSVTQLA